jgi:hypothetical protein
MIMAKFVFMIPSSGLKLMTLRELKNKKGNKSGSTKVRSVEEEGNGEGGKEIEGNKKVSDKVSVYMYVHIHRCIYIDVHIYVYIYTYIYIIIYIYIECYNWFFECGRGERY